MIDKQPGSKRQSELGTGKVVKNPGTIAATSLPANGEQNGSPATEPPTLKELSPEEQMALYEKELKEDDWGHQPC
jgi:hypothetical protein